MKNQFLFAVLLLSTALCAQDMKAKADAPPITKAEAFSTQAGTLIEKQFFELATVKGIEIKVLKYRDVISEKSMASLRFEYEKKTSYTSDTKIAELDSDEIDGLMKSIRALQNVFDTKRDVYTEVTFRSRTGFRCGAFFDIGKKEWRPYLELEKYGESTVFISQQDLAVILSYVVDAQKMM